MSNSEVACNAPLIVFMGKVVQKGEAMRKALLKASTLRAALLKACTLRKAKLARKASKSSSIRSPQKSVGDKETHVEADMVQPAQASVAQLEMEAPREERSIEAHVEELSITQEMNEKVPGGDAHEKGSTEEAAIDSLRETVIEMDEIDDIVSTIMQRNPHLSETGNVADSAPYTSQRAAEFHRNAVLNGSMGCEFDQEGDGRSPVLPDCQSTISALLNWASEFDDDASTLGSCIPVDNSRVEVGPYYVPSSVSPILEAIIKRYGDIAKDCHCQSNIIRSYLLECTCMVFQKLQVPVKHLEVRNFKNYYLAVKNVDTLGLNVKWLLERLDEHLATVDLARKCKDTREAKKKKMEMVESTKKAVELKRAEIENLKSEIQELEDRRSSEMSELTRVKSDISAITSRFKFFRNNSLMGGLF